MDVTPGTGYNTNIMMVTRRAGSTRGAHGQYSTSQHSPQGHSRGVFQVFRFINADTRDSSKVTSFKHSSTTAEVYVLTVHTDAAFGKQYR